MFLMSNFVSACATILDKVLQLYTIVIFVAVAIQWVRPDPFNPIVQTLRAVTEPVFNWVRRLPFAVVGMLDLSPMIVLLLIWFIRLFVVSSLVDLAVRLR